MMKCHRCGNPHDLAMFHRKPKGRLKAPFSNVVKEMLRINRRQICLCNDCFDKAVNDPTVHFVPLKRRLI